jgi:hypothetical protein
LFDWRGNIVDSILYGKFSSYKLPSTGNSISRMDFLSTIIPSMILSIIEVTNKQYAVGARNSLTIFQYPRMKKWGGLKIHLNYYTIKKQVEQALGTMKTLLIIYSSLQGVTWYYKTIIYLQRIYIGKRQIPIWLLYSIPRIKYQEFVILCPMPIMLARWGNKLMLI